MANSTFLGRLFSISSILSLLEDNLLSASEKEERLGEVFGACFPVDATLWIRIMSGTCEPNISMTDTSDSM